MQIKITPGYILAFLLLTMLCGLSHEMVHHVTAAVICGCWGYKTFNMFSLCDTCAHDHLSYIATLAGPIFTFGLIWIGWHKLRKPSMKEKQLGFALIFANFPVNRMLFVLMGSNDEQWAAGQIAGDSQIASWIAILLVYLVTIPVLYRAYKAIGNKKPLVWFLAFFLLPFVFVVLFAGMFLENFVLLKHKFLAETFLGIPYLLINIEFLSTIGYYFTKKYLTGSASMVKNVRHAQ